MFEKIIASNEVKFDDLEKKLYKFIYCIECLIIKIMLEIYDKRIITIIYNKKYIHKGFRKISINKFNKEL